MTDLPPLIFIHDGLDSEPVQAVIMFMFQHHPHRALPHLERIPVRRVDHTLRVPRILLHAEGEHSTFIWRPKELLQQHIHSASASQAMCEGGSHSSGCARLRFSP